MILSNTEWRESQKLITEGKIKILLQWVDTILISISLKAFVGSNVRISPMFEAINPTVIPSAKPATVSKKPHQQQRETPYN
jgi:hypothetical protein